MTASASGASIAAVAPGARIVDEDAVIVFEAEKLMHMRRHADCLSPSCAAPAPDVDLRRGADWSKFARARRQA